jgi:hypothetical protein
MFSYLLTLTLVVGTDADSAQKRPKVEIPRLVDGPAPLKPISSQRPLVRPVLAPATIEKRPSLNLPTVANATSGGAFPSPSLKFSPLPQTTIGTVPIPNGCGSESSIIKSWPILQSPFGARFGEACNVHDICYGTFGANKDVCDSRFLLDLYRACLTAPTAGRTTPTCLGLANIYHLAVSRFGDTPYRQAQTQAVFPTLSSSALLSDRPTTVWDKASLFSRASGTGKFSLGVDLRMPSALKTSPTFPNSAPRTAPRAPRNVQPTLAPSWHPPMTPPSKSAPAPESLAHPSGKRR